MLAKVVLFLPVLPLVKAFLDTVPLVGFSSSSFVPDLSAGLQNILSQDAVCTNYDAIIIVDQPGLHASDLRAISESSPLASLLKETPSSIRLPYLRTSKQSPVTLSKELAQLCGSQHIQVYVGHPAPAFDKSRKHVLLISVPEMDSLHDHDEEILDKISSLVAIFKRHLVLLTGSQSSVSKRQEPRESTPTVAPPLKPALGFRLLTPPLVISLFMTFGIFIPILLISFNALASIRSPMRMDSGKFPTAEKKNQ